jgi:hypothetical protein
MNLTFFFNLTPANEAANCDLGSSEAGEALSFAEAVSTAAGGAGGGGGDVTAGFVAAVVSSWIAFVMASENVFASSGE